MVEKLEELVNLRLRKISIVTGIFHFKSVEMLASARHDIWQWVEAGVAHWHANGVVAVFLQQLDQYGFAVETSFAPASKFDFVNFFQLL